ncbi:hypothetical protein JTB14_009978 [Gonioctena quinquepunctata]|nr:hypothetical protein JTB14_009978 [Gonioctena quinquepunctata]
MNEIGRGKTLKRVNLTRWSARGDACKSLRDSWDEVFTVLKMIENDTTEKPVPRNEAKGICIKLEKHGTAFMVVFWNAILERLNKVSVDSELICRCIDGIWSLWISSRVYNSRARKL